MNTSCMSSLCELIAREESNLTEKLDVYGAQREYSLRQKWLCGHPGSNVAVLDLQHAAVHEQGDVTLCSGATVGGTIGSFGCSEMVSEGRCDPSFPALDKVIVIAQLWDNIYFHAIIDGLPRLISALDYLPPAERANDWLVHGMMEEPLAA